MGPDSGWPGLHDPCRDSDTGGPPGGPGQGLPALGKSGRFHEGICDLDVPKVSSYSSTICFQKTWARLSCFRQIFEGNKGNI